jgi:hypothetical protein
MYTLEKSTNSREERNKYRQKRKAGTKILMWLPEQHLELVNVFKEASRNFTIIFFFEKSSCKFIIHFRMSRQY